MKVEIKWEPRDLWIGVYWRRERQRQLSKRRPKGATRIRVFVCLLPALPIVFSARWMAIR
jgi:hypothetical protein